MKRTILSLVLFGALSFIGVAHAAPDGVIRQSNAVCDPYNPSNCLQPSSSGSIAVATPSGASVATTQVACATTATLLLAADATKAARNLSNQSGVTIYVGGASITTATGIAVPTGSGWDFSHFTGALYCIVATGTATVGTITY